MKAFVLKVNHSIVRIELTTPFIQCAHIYLSFTLLGFVKISLSLSIAKSKNIIYIVLQARNIAFWWPRPRPFPTLFERPPSHHRFFYLSIVLHLIESASLKKSIFKLSGRIQDGVWACWSREMALTAIQLRLPSTTSTSTETLLHRLMTYIGFRFPLNLPFFNLSLLRIFRMPNISDVTCNECSKV